MMSCAIIEQIDICIDTVFLISLSFWKRTDLERVRTRQLFQSFSKRRLLKHVNLTKPVYRRPDLLVCSDYCVL